MCLYHEMSTKIGCLDWIIYPVATQQGFSPSFS